jgi:hypothetical protein
MAVLACALPLRAAAQDDKKPPPNPDVVTVDLRARTLGGTLPFDQSFDLRGAADTATDAIVLHYGLLKDPDEDDDEFSGTVRCAVWVRQPGRRALESNFVFDIPSLQLAGNKDYLLQFSLYELTSPGGLKQPADKTACLQRDDITALYQGDSARAVRLSDSVAIRGDTDLEFSQFFDTDLGPVYAPAAGYVGFGSGVHVFFRPVNKKLDLAELGNRESLSRRLTFYLGLAVTELRARDGVDPLLSVGSPMIGFGLRGPLYWRNFQIGPDWAARPTRLNAGVILFKQDDPNPLVDETSTKAGLFISATADLDLKTILGPFVALLPN